MNNYRILPAISSKRRRLLALLAIGGLATANPARSSQPLRLIVPLAPGSMSDTFARAMAPSVDAALRQSVVVYNMPGASGAIGLRALMRAPADGNAVITLTPSTLVINELTREDWPYKSKRDIRLLTIATRGPMVLAVSGNASYNSLQEFLDAARKQPGMLSVGGYGDFFRISTAALEQAANVRFSYVPYAGAAGTMTTNVISGEVDAAQFDLSSASSLILDGRLKALAICGHKRSVLLPSVPTMQELGIPYENEGWMGLGVRKDTSDDVALRIEEALLQAIKGKEFRDVVSRTGGNEVVALTGVQAEEYIAGERKRFAQVVHRMSKT